MLTVRRLSNHLWRSQAPCRANTVVARNLTGSTVLPLRQVVVRWRPQQRQQGGVMQRVTFSTRALAQKIAATAASTSSREEAVIASHTPVLLDEVVELWHNPQARRGDGTYVDCTAGAGHHARRLLQTYPSAKVLCIDVDSEMLDACRLHLAEFGDRVAFAQGSYKDLKQHLEASGFPSKVDGIFTDLGFNSAQVEDPRRGFSYVVDGPLDMRFDKKGIAVSAGDIVNKWSFVALEKIFREFGDEPESHVVAQAILEWRGTGVRRRKILSTLELRFVIDNAITLARGKQDVPRTAANSTKNDYKGFWRKDKRARWNSRTRREKELRRLASSKPKHTPVIARCFQALRMAVNTERHHLKVLLADVFNHLTVGGRFVSLAFHPLEDSPIVALTDQVTTLCEHRNEYGVCKCSKDVMARSLTEDAIRPSHEQVKANRRCRSAHLRAFERQCKYDSVPMMRRVLQRSDNQSSVMATPHNGLSPLGSTTAQLRDASARGTRHFSTRAAWHSAAAHAPYSTTAAAWNSAESDGSDFEFDEESMENLGSMGPEDLMKMRQELEKLELKLKSAMPGNGEDLEHAEYIRTLQNMMQTSATLTAAAAENDNDEELERQLMSSEGEEEDAEEYGAMSEQEGSEAGEEAEEDLLAEDAPWMKEGAMDAILGDAEGDDPIPVMRYGEPAEAFHARLRAHQESMLRDPSKLKALGQMAGLSLEFMERNPTAVADAIRGMPLTSVDESDVNDLRGFTPLAEQMTNDDTNTESASADSAPPRFDFGGEQPPFADSFDPHAAEHGSARVEGEPTREPSVIDVDFSSDHTGTVGATKQRRSDSDSDRSEEEEEEEEEEEGDGEGSTVQVEPAVVQEVGAMLDEIDSMEAGDVEKLREDFQQFDTKLRQEASSTAGPTAVEAKLFEKLRQGGTAPGQEFEAIKQMLAMTRDAVAQDPKRMEKVAQLVGLPLEDIAKLPDMVDNIDPAMFSDRMAAAAAAQSQPQAPPQPHPQPRARAQSQARPSAGGDEDDDLSAEGMTETVRSQLDGMIEDLDKTSTDFSESPFGNNVPFGAKPSKAYSQIFEEGGTVEDKLQAFHRALTDMGADMLNNPWELAHMAENAGLDPEIVKEVLADSGVDPAAEAAKAKAAKNEATAAEAAAAAAAAGATKAQAQAQEQEGTRFKSAASKGSGKAKQKKPKKGAAKAAQRRRERKMKRDF